MTINSDDLELDDCKVQFPLHRNALFELVWSMPMTSLAEKCGVSSSYLARVCTQMSVPRPERGYWAKLAAGKKVNKPSLPEPRPEDLLEWNIGKGITQSQSPKVIPSARQSVRRRLSKGSWHPLLRGVKELFLKGKETEGGYLRPSKRILPDLLVSAEGLDRVLKLANDVYWSIEEKGHKVLLEPKHSDYLRPGSESVIEPGTSIYYPTYWYPYRSTFVYVGEVVIGVMLVEKSEEVECAYDSSIHQYVRVQKNKGEARPYSWTTKRFLPSGKFEVVAYSPYLGTKWQKVWLIPSLRGNKQFIESMAAEIIDAAPIISKLHAEALELREKRKREWEIERQEQRKAEQERLRVKAIEDSRLLLNQLIESWGEAERINRFFDQAEQVVSRLSAEQREVLIGRIVAARALVGEVNALESLMSWRSPEELLGEVDSPYLR